VIGLSFRENVNVQSPSPLGRAITIYLQHLILSLSKDEVLVARILRQAQDEEVFSPHPPAGPKKKNL
jgi:hypothetical protein